VVAYYPNVNEARKAIQENKIYAFLYFPKGTTEELLSSRQPKISFYYSNTSLTAGAQLMKDLKTISSRGSAAVGQATLRAKGATDKQVQTFLQPIRVDLHAVHNPYTNYNYYLSTFLVPGILLLFIFLISTYSLGTELKFKDSHNLMEMAGNNIHVALIGKFLPQTLIYLIILLGYSWYVFGYLHFPYEGSYWMIIMLAVLTVLVGQAFGIFIFGLMPSLRMSMSICSLWAMLGFTACGATFPVMAMDSPIVALANLFPLRHYYMIYQLCIFNGYPIDTAWFHFMAMGIFLSLPFFVNNNIRRAMLEFQYIP
jgi:ABC-2 type transport system permease protein